MSVPKKRTYRCMECGVEKSTYALGRVPLRCATCRNLVQSARQRAKLMRQGPKDEVQARIYAAVLAKERAG